MSVDTPSDPDDLPELTPLDRLHAISAIIAAGVSRLSLAATTTSDELREVVENPLEEPG